MKEIWNNLAEVLIWRIAMTLSDDSRLLWMIDGSSIDECTDEFWEAIAPTRWSGIPWSFQKQLAVSRKQYREPTQMEKNQNSLSILWTVHRAIKESSHE